MASSFSQHAERKQPNRRLQRHFDKAHNKNMLLPVLAFVLGIVSWTFVEYAVHGWMAHLYPTFVQRIHAVHHRDPRAVFAIGAWPFVALLLIVPAAVWGICLSTLFLCGLVSGFASYEIIHYRLHFARVLTPFEERLRRRHLVHHYANPEVCLGVSTSFWDRIFHTEPNPEQLKKLLPKIAKFAPLEGPTNLRQAPRLMFGAWLQSVWR